jgi:hypothetical protein
MMHHPRMPLARGLVIVALICGAQPTSVSSAASGTPANGMAFILARGLWVWKSPSVLGAAGGAEKLRDFCQSNGINEVYVSVSATSGTTEDPELTHLIELLHGSRVRIEALLSSTDADEPGKYRDKFLDHVRRIVQFNKQHPNSRFDGVHLDIEPQQRSENKGAGNLKFLSDLVATYHAARELAEPANLTVNADIQNKLLKGSPSERAMLLTALPRFTLMLYEVSSPGDGETADQMADKIRKASGDFLDMAYQGLDPGAVATMTIGLRTPDYGARLPQMLDAVDASNRTNQHYGGWARHSYNDYLNAP